MELTYDILYVLSLILSVRGQGDTNPAPVWGLRGEWVDANIITKHLVWYGCLSTVGARDQRYYINSSIAPVSCGEWQEEFKRLPARAYPLNTSPVLVITPEFPCNPYGSLIPELHVTRTPFNMNDVGGADSNLSCQGGSVTCCVLDSFRLIALNISPADSRDTEISS